MSESAEVPSAPGGGFSASRECVFDLTMSAVLLVVWIWLMTEVSKFPDSAQTYPRLVVGGLIVLGTYNLVVSSVKLIRSRARERSGEVSALTRDGMERLPLNTKRLAIFLVASVVYALGMAHVGFIVSSVVFVTVGVCMLTTFTWRRAVLIAIATAVCVGAATQLLSIRLPDTILL